MGKTNKANREVCNVDFRELKTMKPYLFLETANTTGLEINSEDTFAMAHGARSIAFSNPQEDSVTIEAQVFPIELYAMLSDGTIETTAVVAEKATVTATTGGTLTVPENIKTGTLFVYASGDFAGTVIEGTLADTTFTATETSAIESGKDYDIGYLVTKNDVKKVSFTDEKNPQDYYITMLTNDKTEEGVITAKKIVIYKGKPTKSLSLSYSSEGDPISLSITINCLRDKDGNIVDMVELDDEE